MNFKQKKLRQICLDKSENYLSESYLELLSLQQAGKTKHLKNHEILKKSA